MTENDHSAALGRRIAAARKARGWSQVEFADRAGVSKSAVAYWETGQRDVRAWRLPLLCNLLRVTPQYLLGMPEPVQHSSGPRPPMAVLSNQNPGCIEQHRSGARCVRSLHHRNGHWDGKSVYWGGSNG